MLQSIEQRGYIFQSTAGVEQLLKSDTTVFYLGFDCTAKSLHVGHLAPIMLAKKLKSLGGHKAIILLGGGTTKIGDPSGKNQMRKIISAEQIEQNTNSIKKIIKRFLGDAIFVNNADWLDKINYIDFLRDIGAHFSVNRMMEFESVKSRLQSQSHLSFLEFNYMLLQAYDFVELNKRYGCRLQIGGSDQWGNIVNGTELGRKLKTKQLFGITVPLITTSSGKKMGKTESGAVWLDEEMFSPYEYWQYFRNADDKDVKRFLKIFTELREETIDEITNNAQNINEAKKILATEATSICHGKSKAQNALDAAIKEFESGDSSALPVLNLKDEKNLLNAIIQSKIAQSNSEAKRLLKSGAVKINDKKVTDQNTRLNHDDKLSVGKKRFVIEIK